MRPPASFEQSATYLHSRHLVTRYEAIGHWRDDFGRPAPCRTCGPCGPAPQVQATLLRRQDVPTLAGNLWGTPRWALSGQGNCPGGQAGRLRPLDRGAAAGRPWVENRASSPCRARSGRAEERGSTSSYGWARHPAPGRPVAAHPGHVPLPAAWGPHTAAKPGFGSSPSW